MKLTAYLKDTPHNFRQGGAGINKDVKGRKFIDAWDKVWGLKPIEVKGE